jgi:hypothetical protein
VLCRRAHLLKDDRNLVSDQHASASFRTGRGNGCRLGPGVPTTARSKYLTCGRLITVRSVPLPKRVSLPEDWHQLPEVRWRSM